MRSIASSTQIWAISLSLLATCLAGERAGAATITASASGSFAPTLPSPCLGDFSTLVNGDFTIVEGTSTESDCPGDGISEGTFWTFDFTADPSFSSFPVAGSLTSAILTLEVTGGSHPAFGPILADVARIIGLDYIEFEFSTVPTTGDTETIVLDLLSPPAVLTGSNHNAGVTNDPYDPADILAALASGTLGEIDMEHRDDAVVSFAELSLTAVPEPGTMLLVGFGVLSISLRRRVPKRGLPPR